MKASIVAPNRRRETAWQVADTLAGMETAPAREVEQAIGLDDGVKLNFQVPR